MTCLLHTLIIETVPSHREIFCGITWCRIGFSVYIATGNLPRMACSKKPLRICCCLLLLTITISIVSLVVAITTTFILLHRNSSPFSVTTTFNSTVVVPLSKFIESFRITSNRDAMDYSCTLATITLPCSALNRRYSRNQSVYDISNDSGKYYLYLLKGSVMHFQFYNTSICPSYTLWIFRDKLKPAVTVVCKALNEHKLKGRCTTFMGSGTFDYSVPSDAYYFYSGYGCESGRPKLLLTSIDYYWYDFTQYVNYSGVQMVYIPQKQHREITVAPSFSLSRMCTLINTPNTYDCRAGHLFQSLVDISQIRLHPVIWVLCIVPIGCTCLVVSVGGLFLYITFFLIKIAKQRHP